jgi:hypothetical protein
LPQRVLDHHDDAAAAAAVEIEDARDLVDVHADAVELDDQRRIGADDGRFRRRQTAAKRDEADVIRDRRRPGLRGRGRQGRVFAGSFWMNELTKLRNFIMTKLPSPLPFNPLVDELLH